MNDQNNQTDQDIELLEWLESLDYVIQIGDHERVQKLLLELQARAAMSERRISRLDPSGPVAIPRLFGRIYSKKINCLF